MCWTLTGRRLLVLICLCVPLNSGLQISQRPRFYGVKASSPLGIKCLSSKQQEPGGVRWFKAKTYDTAREKRHEIQGNERIQFPNITRMEHAFLYFLKVQPDDSGVYFCRINHTWGPGTELHVVKPVDRSQVSYRTQLKDGLMVLQGLLLAVCIAAILLRKQQLLERRDSIYEEPETDHIYEGLAIESGGGGLYEELEVYAQADGAEAPWE